MNNRKGFTRQEWSVILPIKQEIIKELKEEGVSWKMIRNEVVRQNKIAWRE